jgi:hypothetical protein
MDYGLPLQYRCNVEFELHGADGRKRAAKAFSDLKATTRFAATILRSLVAAAVSTNKALRCAAAMIADSGWEAPSSHDPLPD